MRFVFWEVWLDLETKPISHDIYLLKVDSSLIRPFFIFTINYNYHVVIYSTYSYTFILISINKKINLIISSNHNGIHRLIKCEVDALNLVTVLNNSELAFSHLCSIAGRNPWADWAWLACSLILDQKRREWSGQE